MNTVYGSNMEIHLLEAISAAENIEYKKPYTWKKVSHLIKKLKKLSYKEDDRATEELCVKLGELLARADETGFLSSFERRILMDTLQTMRTYAASVSQGFPSSPSYHFAMEALDACQRLRAVDVAA